MLISKQFELTSLCVCVLKNGAYCLFSLGLIPLAFTSRLKGEINGNTFGSMRFKEFLNSTSGCPLFWGLFEWTRLGWAGELHLPEESQAGFCTHNEMAESQFYRHKVFISSVFVPFLRLESFPRAYECELIWRAELQQQKFVVPFHHLVVRSWIATNLMATSLLGEMQGSQPSILSSFVFNQKDGVFGKINLPTSCIKCN